MRLQMERRMEHSLLNIICATTLSSNVQMFNAHRAHTPLAIQFYRRYRQSRAMKMTITMTMTISAGKRTKWQQERLREAKNEQFQCLRWQDKGSTRRKHTEGMCERIYCVTHTSWYLLLLFALITFHHHRHQHQHFDLRRHFHFISINIS